MDLNHMNDEVPGFLIGSTLPAGRGMGQSQKPGRSCPTPCGGRTIGFTSLAPAWEDTESSSWQQRDTKLQDRTSVGVQSAKPPCHKPAAIRPRSSRSHCDPDPSRKAEPRGQVLPATTPLPCGDGQDSGQYNSVVCAPISELDHALSGLKISLRYRSVRQRISIIIGYETEDLKNSKSP